MTFLILVGLMIFGIGSLTKKVAQNPEKTAAWAGIVHGFLKR